MAVNKVVVANEVKLDLTADSITPEKLVKGVTAHDRTGAPIIGTAEECSPYVQGTTLFIPKGVITIG